MIKNCTPHDICVHVVSASAVIKFPPCGIIPRCEQREIFVDKIDTIPVTKQVFGEVIDLPEQEDGVYLVVSRLVAAACPNRSDLLIPGPLVRDEAGKVIGCKGLSKL